jgi:hypothetical protein
VLRVIQETQVLKERPELKEHKVLKVLTQGLKDRKVRQVLKVM